MAKQTGWKPQVEGYTDSLTNGEYHRQKWATSSTYIKRMFQRSQAYAESNHVEIDIMQDALIGNAVHTLVLVGREELDKQYSQLRNNVLQRIHNIKREIIGFTPARDLLASCPTRERSFFWQDEKTISSTRPSSVSRSS